MTSDPPRWPVLLACAILFLANVAGAVQIERVM